MLLQFFNSWVVSSVVYKFIWICSENNMQIFQAICCLSSRLSSALYAYSVDLYPWWPMEYKM